MVLSRGKWQYFDRYSALQCDRSSLSYCAHCSVKCPMTLKMWIKRSQLFPKMVEIVLQPFWWVAGTEQPSPTSSPGGCRPATEVF